VHRLCDRCDLLEAALDDGVEHRLPVGEEVVQPSDRDVGGSGNRRRRDPVGTERVDELGSCVEHALDTLATSGLDRDPAQDSRVASARVIGLQLSCLHRSRHTVPSSLTCSLKPE
jgi:hypothetical protein